MEIKAYLAILWRRKWIIVNTLAVTLIVVGIATYMVRPTYAATTTLRITTPANLLGDTVGYDDNMYLDRLINTYTKIATSDAMQQQLKHTIGVDKDIPIEIDVPANTELMRITAEHEDPALAGNAANTLANILVAQASSLATEERKTSGEILRQQLTQMEGELREARNQLQNLNSPQDSQALTHMTRSIE